MVEYKIIGMPVNSVPSNEQANESNVGITKFNYDEERPFIQDFADRYLSRNRRTSSGYSPDNYADSFRELKVRDKKNIWYQRYENHLRAILRVVDSLKILALAENKEETLKKLIVENDGKQYCGLLKVVNRFFKSGVNEDSLSKASEDSSYRGYVEKLKYYSELYEKFGDNVTYALVSLHDLFKNTDDTNHVLYTVKLLVEGDRPYTREDFKGLFKSADELERFWQGLSSFNSDTDGNFITIDINKNGKNLFEWIDLNFKGSSKELKGIFANNTLIDRYSRILGKHKDIFLPVLMMHQIMGASFTNTSYSQLMYFIKMPEVNLTKTQLLLKKQLAGILVDKDKTKEMLDMLEYLTIIDTSGAVSGAGKQGYLSLQAIENISGARPRMERVFEELAKDIPEEIVEIDKKIEFMLNNRLTADKMVDALRKVMCVSNTDEPDVDEYSRMVRTMTTMYVDDVIDEPEFQSSIRTVFKEATSKLREKISKFSRYAHLILDQQYINTFSASLVAKNHGLDICKKDSDSLNYMSLDVSKIDLNQKDAEDVLKLNMIFSRFTGLVQKTITKKDLFEVLTDKERVNFEVFWEELLKVKGITKVGEDRILISSESLAHTLGAISSLAINILSAEQSKIMDKIQSLREQTQLLTFATQAGNSKVFTADEVNSLFGLDDDEFYDEFSKSLISKDIHVLYLAANDRPAIYNTVSFKNALLGMGMPGVRNNMQQELLHEFCGDTPSLINSVRAFLGFAELSALKSDIANGKRIGKLTKDLDNLVFVRSKINRDGANLTDFDGCVNMRRLNMVYNLLQKHSKISMGDLDQAFALAGFNRKGDSEKMLELLKQAGCVDYNNTVISADLSNVDFSKFSSVSEKKIKSLQKILQGILSDSLLNRRIVEIVDQRISAENPEYLPQLRDNRFLNITRTSIGLSVLLLSWTAYFNVTSSVSPSIVARMMDMGFSFAMMFFTFSSFVYNKTAFIDAGKKYEPMLPELDLDPMKRAPGFSAHNAFGGENIRNRLGYLYRYLWYGPQEKADFQIGSAGYAETNNAYPFEFNRAKYVGKIIERLLRAKVFDMPEYKSRYDYGPKRNVENDEWAIRDISVSLAINPMGEDGLEILTQAFQQPRNHYDPKSWATRKLYYGFYRKFTTDNEHVGGTIATEKTLTYIIEELRHQAENSDNLEEKNKLIKQANALKDNMRSIILAGDIRDFVIKDSCDEILTGVLSDKLSDSELKELLEFVEQNKDKYLFQSFEDLGKGVDQFYYLDKYLPSSFKKDLEPIYCRAICRDFINMCRKDAGSADTISELGQKILTGQTLEDEDKEKFIRALGDKYSISNEKANKIIQVLIENSLDIIKQADEANRSYVPKDAQARKMRWQLEEQFWLTLPEEGLRNTRTLLDWKTYREQIIEECKGTSFNEFIDEYLHRFDSKPANLYERLPNLLKLQLSKAGVTQAEFVRILDESMRKANKGIIALTYVKTQQGDMTEEEVRTGVHMFLSRIEKELLLYFMTAGDKILRFLIKQAVEPKEVSTGADKEVLESSLKKFKNIYRNIGNDQNIFVLPISVMESNSKMLKSLDYQGIGNRLFISAKSQGYDNILAQVFNNIDGLKFLQKFTCFQLASLVSREMSTAILSSEQKEKIFTEGKYQIYSDDPQSTIEVENINNLTYEQVMAQIEEQWVKIVEDRVSKVAYEFISKLVKENKEYNASGELFNIGVNVKGGVNAFIREAEIQGIVAQVTSQSVDAFLEDWFRIPTASYGMSQEIARNDDLIDKLKGAFKQDNYFWFKKFIGSENEFRENKISNETSKKELIEQLASVVLDATKQELDKDKEKRINEINGKIGMREDNLFQKNILMSQREVYRKEIAELLIEKRTLQGITPDTLDLFREIVNGIDRAASVGISNVNDGQFMYYGQFFTYEELKSVLFSLLLDEGPMVVEIGEKSAIYKTRGTMIDEVILGKIDAEINKKMAKIEEIETEGRLSNGVFGDKKIELSSLYDELKKLHDFRKTASDTLANLRSLSASLKKKYDGPEILSSLKISLENYVDALGKKQKLLNAINILINGIKVRENDIYKDNISPELTLTLTDRVYNFFADLKEENITEKNIDEMADKFVQDREAILLDGVCTMNRAFNGKKPMVTSLIKNIRELKKNKSLSYKSKETNILTEQSFVNDQIDIDSSKEIYSILSDKGFISEGHLTKKFFEEFEIADGNIENLIEVLGLSSTFNSVQQLEIFLKALEEQYEPDRHLLYIEDLREDNLSENSFRTEMFHIMKGPHDSYGRKGGLWNRIYVGIKHGEMTGNFLRRITERLVDESTGRHLYMPPGIANLIYERVYGVITLPVKEKAKRGIIVDTISSDLMTKVISEKQELEKVVNEMVDAWDLKDEDVYPGSKRKRTVQDIKDRLMIAGREMAVSHYALKYLKGGMMGLREIMRQFDDPSYKIENMENEDFQTAKEMYAFITGKSYDPSESLKKFTMEDVESKMKEFVEKKMNGDWNHIAKDKWIRTQISEQIDYSLSLLRQDEEKLAKYLTVQHSLSFANECFSQFFINIGNGVISSTKKANSNETEKTPISIEVNKFLENLERQIKGQPTPEQLAEAIKKYQNDKLNGLSEKIDNETRIVMNKKLEEALRVMQKGVSSLISEHTINDFRMVKSLVSLYRSGIISSESVKELSAIQMAKITAKLVELGIFDRATGEFLSTFDDEKKNKLKAEVEMIINTKVSGDHPDSLRVRNVFAENISKWKDVSINSINNEILEALRKNKGELYAEMVVRNSVTIEKLVEHFTKKLLENSSSLEGLNYTTKIGGTWTNGTWYTETSRREPITPKRKRDGDTDYLYQEYIRSVFVGEEKSVNYTQLREWAVYTRLRTMEEITEQMSSDRSWERKNRRLPMTRKEFGEEVPFMQYLIDVAKIADSRKLNAAITTSTSDRELGDKTNELLKTISMVMQTEKRKDGTLLYDPLTEDYALVALSNPNVYDDLGSTVEVTDEAGNRDPHRTQLKLGKSIDADNVVYKSFERLRGLFSWDFNNLRMRNREMMGVQAPQSQKDRVGSDKFNLNSTFLTTQLVFNHDISGDAEATNSKNFPCGCYFEFSVDFLDLADYTEFLEHQDLQMDSNIIKYMTRVWSNIHKEGWWKTLEKISQKGTYEEWTSPAYFNKEEKEIALNITRFGIRGFLQYGSWIFMPAILASFAGGSAGLALTMPLWFMMHNLIHRSYVNDTPFNHKWVTYEILSYLGATATALGVAGGIFALTAGSTVALSLVPITTVLVMLVRNKVFNNMLRDGIHDNPEYMNEFFRHRVASMAEKGQLEHGGLAGFRVQSFEKALEDSSQDVLLHKKEKTQQSTTYLLSTNPRDISWVTKKGQFATRWIPKSLADEHEKIFMDYLQKGPLGKHYKAMGMLNYPHLFFFLAYMPIYLGSYLLFNTSSINFGNFDTELTVPFVDGQLQLPLALLFGIVSVINMWATRYLPTRKIMDAGLPKEQAELQHSFQYWIMWRMMINNIISHPKIGRENSQIFNLTIEIAAPLSELKAQNPKYWTPFFNILKSDEGYPRTMLFVYTAYAAALVAMTVGSVVAGNVLLALITSGVLGYFVYDMLKVLEGTNHMLNSGAEMKADFAQGEHSTRLYGMHGNRRILANVAASTLAVSAVPLLSDLLAKLTISLGSDIGILASQFINHGFIQFILGLVALAYTFKHVNWKLDRTSKNFLTGSPEVPKLGMDFKAAHRLIDENAKKRQLLLENINDESVLNKVEISLQETLMKSDDAFSSLKFYEAFKYNNIDVDNDAIEAYHQKLKDNEVSEKQAAGTVFLLKFYNNSIDMDNSLNQLDFMNEIVYLIEAGHSQEELVLLLDLVASGESSEFIKNNKEVFLNKDKFVNHLSSLDIAGGWLLIDKYLTTRFINRTFESSDLFKLIEARFALRKTEGVEEILTAGFIQFGEKFSDTIREGLKKLKSENDKDKQFVKNISMYCLEYMVENNLSNEVEVLTFIEMLKENNLVERAEELRVNAMSRFPESVRLAK